VDALVNVGILAQQRGRFDEAVDSWERAVDIDPLQGNAQLYLAQALDRRGEAQAAARHLRAWLQIVASHPNEHLGEKNSVIAAFIKVADADAAVNRSVQALEGYAAAIDFAKKADDKVLESLALVHRAELQEKQGDVSAAALSLQNALLLDAFLTDSRSTASDWLNYGQFLRRHQQPERMVFACLLRAEDLMSATPGDELSVMVGARRQSESTLGREAASVRKNSEAVSKGALSLPASSFAPAH
jgi:tetratricopeptide (TPR) repeat protein